MKFICRDCNKSYGGHKAPWQCECRGALWVDADIEFHREDIRREEMTMWRYDAAFPIKKEEARITFGEGMTPLARFPWKGSEVQVKNERLMPTGSFKDRGVAMMVNYLHQSRVTRVTEDSSGNAGASVAAYCALAGMECDIFIPRGTLMGKVSQAKCFGANLHQVPGTRDDTVRAAQMAKGGVGVCAGHNWHLLFFRRGQIHCL